MSNEKLTFKLRTYRKLCNILMKQLPDSVYLKMLYQVRMGKKLNLKRPITYNEKLNWLKIHDRNPYYTQLADKYRVKNIVAEKIGDQYIIPTLAVWDNVDDIDISYLPEKFVLKCTHDSSSIVFCKNKEQFDLDAAKRKLDNALKNNFFYYSREWVYKNITPRIICEPFIEFLGDKPPIDYKFFCFNGRVQFMFVATNRNGENADFDFFDRNYNHLDFRQGHPNAVTIPEKPENYELMLELAEKLSAGIPHVRVDFYDSQGQVYFGEMTFYHHSGLVKFDPEDWDYVFGKALELPVPDQFD